MLRNRSTIVGMPVVIMLLLIVTALAIGLVGNGQASHLPIRIMRFANIGNDANFNTGLASSSYHCVATGWSGRWDVQEDNAGNNHVWTQVQPTFEGNRWFVRASFNSHNDHENLDVDVVCFPTDLATFTGSPTVFDPD